MDANLQPVRPLGPEQDRPTRNPPPSLLLVIGLLTVGAVVGWAIASLGGDSVATASSTTLGDDGSATAGLDQGDLPSISWQRAQSVPPIPAGLQYAGATEPVALGGSVYLVVNFSHPDSGTITPQLWSSEDRRIWQAENLDLGVQAEVVEATAIGDGLILSARTEDGWGMWRSPLERAIDGASWTRLPFDLPDNVEVRFHRTAVSSGGEVTTVVIGELEIWREILAPYTPDDIDINDPELVLFMGSVVRPGEDVPYQILSSDPEVLTTHDSIWVRVVDLDGREELFTGALPEGTYPLESAPELGAVAVALAWRSDDGVEFIPIIGKGALPPGYFLPEPWQGGFVAAAFEQIDSFAPNGRVRLWSSASGRAWQPLDDQPPRECAGIFLAVSGNRLLLTDGNTGCLWTGDRWDVLTEPVDAMPVTGGPAGFLGLQREFDSTTAVFSRDGRAWVDAELPAGEPFRAMSVLDDGLFALATTQPGTDEPFTIEIWLGEVE